MAVKKDSLNERFTSISKKIQNESSLTNVEDFVQDKTVEATFQSVEATKK